MNWGVFCTFSYEILVDSTVARRRANVEISSGYEKFVDEIFTSTAIKLRPPDDVDKFTKRTQGDGCAVVVSHKRWENPCACISQIFSFRKHSVNTGYIPKCVIQQSKFRFFFRITEVRTSAIHYYVITRCGSYGDSVNDANVADGVAATECWRDAIYTVRYTDAVCMRTGGVPHPAHGHLVGGQGSGLVGADHRRAAERLDRRQTSNDGVLLRHPTSSECKTGRDDGRQSLRYGGNGQRHGNLEVVDGALYTKTSQQPMRYSTRRFQCIIMSTVT